MEPAGKSAIPAGPSVAGTQAGAGVRGEMPRGPWLGAGICGSPQNAAAARPAPSPPSAGSRAAMAALARAWHGLGAVAGHGGGGGSAQFGHSGAGRGCRAGGCGAACPHAGGAWTRWHHRGRTATPTSLHPTAQPHGAFGTFFAHPHPPCTPTPFPVHTGAEPPQSPVPRCWWPRPGRATAQPTRPLSIEQLLTALSPSESQICPHRGVCAPRNQCCPLGGQQQRQGAQTGTRCPQKPHPVTCCSRLHPPRPTPCPGSALNP